MSLKIKKQFRSLSAELVRAADAEPSDTIEFSFSSEEPVGRWFGEEVLSHEKSAADFSRLNDGANFLWNHDSDKVLGVLEKAYIGKDKRGYATIRWGTSAFAQEKRKDVEAGILRNVSFGYQVKEMNLQNPGVKNEEPKYLATKWMPFEVSCVSVPADQSVGLGRAADEEFEVTVVNKHAVSVKEKTMDEEQKKAEAAKREAEIKQLREEGVKVERDRQAAINVLGQKFGKADLARQLIESGKSLEESRDAFLEHLGAVKQPVSDSDGNVGLNEKETREFSFMRAINALANPHDIRLQEEASFERECSRAAAKLAGKTSRGIMIPTDVLRASRRDMTAGSNSAGGYTVATDLKAGSFIELLRNKMVVQRLGAMSLNGLVGNLTIPKMTGGATAYWVAENAAPTEGAQTLGQVAMSPKTVAGYTDISRRLSIQSSIDFEGMVKNDLAMSLALAVDAKALYGDGSSNTITGVRYASSLNTVDFAGANPTYAEIVDMESQIAADNADVGTLAYVMNALARGVLKTTAINSTYGDRMIWEPGNTVNGYRAEVSNQVSKLSTADYDYFFGNWADLMIGFWSGLDLMVDPYTGSKEGTIRVTAFQDVDCAVRHGESFCYGNKTIS